MWTVCSASRASVSLRERDGRMDRNTGEYQGRRDDVKKRILYYKFTSFFPKQNLNIISIEYFTKYIHIHFTISGY